MSEKALTVKLSDRFNNIADAFTASERFRNNYYRETCAIVDAIESSFGIAPNVKALAMLGTKRN